MPQEPGLPEHPAGSEDSPPPEAKTESFFTNFFDPHFGQAVPFHLLVRTRISLSVPHFPQ
jgi:hypothetical protein